MSLGILKMSCFLMPYNSFLEPGDGALQPKPTVNCYLYTQKK